MELVQLLRHAWQKDSDKVFINKHGAPLSADAFRADYWNRMLDALGIRKRKFYATHAGVSDGAINSSAEIY